MTEADKDAVAFRPSAACEGERCYCGETAAKKIGEEILFDDPMPHRHNLTRYVCAAHYAQIMGPLGAKQVGLASLARQATEQVSDDAPGPVAPCCLPGGACYEAGLADVQHEAPPAPKLDDAVEALTDIRNRILCPVGPTPTLEQIGEIASAALAKLERGR